MAKKTEETKRKPGPWIKKFKPGVDLKKPSGVCKVKGCKVKVEGKWCVKHKKEIRTLQLALNNLKWRPLAATGEADHHIVYTVDGKTMATEWARLNPEKALKQAEKKGTVSPPELKKLLHAANVAHTAKRREEERQRKEANVKRSKTMKAKGPKKAAKKAPTKKAASKKVTEKKVVRKPTSKHDSIPETVGEPTYSPE